MKTMCHHGTLKAQKENETLMHFGLIVRLLALHLIGHIKNYQESLHNPIGINVDLFHFIF